mgnify:CR=1 FL=1
MSDPNSLIDSLLRGVMIAGVNRLVFKGQPVFSMSTVNEGVRLGAASVGYDLIIRPAVKQVLPMIPLPNGSK